jgi:RimJ/RimL family protein N-acetyltransferase
MQEIPVSQYALVHPLFAPLAQHHLAIQSLLAGRSAGTVLADNPDRPRTTLAWTSHRVFLAGEPTNVDALAELLAQLPLPAEYGLYVTPGWEQALGTRPLVNPGKTVLRRARHFYRGDALLYDWRKLIPEEFTLRWIDASPLGETHLRNLPDLVEELQSERESVAAFLQHGFGVCAQIGDEIAGWCMSEYYTGPRLEIGIGTVEAYRRKGLAAAMASALIDPTLAHGYTEIGWHCWANNAASIAAARKLGLGKAAEYPVWLAY